MTLLIGGLWLKLQLKPLKRETFKKKKKKGDILYPEYTIAQDWV